MGQNNQAYMGGLGFPVVSGRAPSNFGRHFFVDGNGGSDSNSGRRPDRPFLTMAQAFNSIDSGDVIMFRGNIREQLSTPVGVFDVTVIGAGFMKPRHADAHTGDNGYASATWKSPASPAAATPLLIVRQQGWRFENFLFAAPTDEAAVRLLRDAGAGDAERDASHASFSGMRFDGGQDHINWHGGPSFIVIENHCLFRGATAISLKNTVGAGVGTNLCCRILDSEWYQNAANITLPLSAGLIRGNTIGPFTAAGSSGGIDLRGGVGNNVITMNYLSGTYSHAGGYFEAAATDEWGGNMNVIAGGLTAADPA